LSNLFYSSKIIENLNIEFIEDNVTNISLIKPTGKVLLYNLSIFIESDRSFYRSDDKRLKQSLMLKTKPRDQIYMDILKSYEADSEKSIEDLFAMI
jgi:hypothetical protein